MRTGSEAPAVEPPSAEGAAVAVRGLAHGFGELEVLQPLDLEIGAGQVVALVGPSGCGKSTLLELVAGLAAQRAGTIEVGARREPEHRLAACAYMPQRDLLLPWLAAIDNAALAARNRGATRAAARGEAHPLFERFGLAGFEAAYPRELSGGMRQRVAFLRTLLAGKPVLLLDEPFASLDAITRAEMQEWLAEALAGEARTVILVSHDVEEALYLADRVVVLSPRPARVVAELHAPGVRSRPRVEAIAHPGFVAARDQALEALGVGR